MKEKLRDFFHIVGLDIRRWDDLSVFSRQLIHILKYLEINLVLDVGAHWGEYAEMLFRCGYDGNVTSFEPATKAWEILSKKSNNQWHMVRAACGKTREEEKEIIISGGNNSSSSFLKMLESHIRIAPYSSPVGTEKVFINRLDAMGDYAGNRKTFLKIDTQGYEMKVLEGSTGIIDRIKGVQVELSTEELYEGQALDWEIKNWLQERGFVLWALNPFLYNPKSGKLLQYDAIFIRE